MAGHRVTIEWMGAEVQTLEDLFPPTPLAVCACINPAPSSAVITNDLRGPAGSLAVGVPATIKEGRSHPKLIEMMAQVYVDNARRYQQGLRRLD